MQIDVRFPCDDGFSMGGVLSLPDSRDGRARPALLLLHEVFGLNDEMRRVARDFVDEGYVVLIPDLFSRGPKALCVARAMRAVANQEGQPLDDLEAARRWLVALPEVDGERVGVLGFCLGGGFALVLAMNGKYRAAAPFYGEAPRSMPRSCPVVASYGARDQVFGTHGERVRRSLEVLGVPHDVRTYEDAGHSFFTHAPAGLFGRLGGLPPLFASYHEPSASDAKARVTRFFREHVMGEPGAAAPQG